MYRSGRYGDASVIAQITIASPAGDMPIDSRNNAPGISPIPMTCVRSPVIASWRTILPRSSKRSATLEPSGVHSASIGVPHVPASTLPGAPSGWTVLSEAVSRMGSNLKKAIFPFAPGRVAWARGATTARTSDATRKQPIAMRFTVGPPFHAENPTLGQVARRGK